MIKHSNLIDLKINTITFEHLAFLECELFNSKVLLDIVFNKERFINELLESEKWPDHFKMKLDLVADQFHLIEYNKFLQQKIILHSN